jgi:hypothetical protein
MSPGSFDLRAEHPLARLRPVALVVGLAALALCGLGSAFDMQQFLRSYLVGYLFWFCIALGCLAVLMIHHVAGGAWGAVVRRLLESAAATIPLLALLFLPIALGVHEIYEWAHPGAVVHDPILAAKEPYLNVPFFLGRAVLYFVVWTVVATLLNRWSSDQDRVSDAAVARRLELLSRGGLVLYGLTITFAAVDWMMSLEPHWFSTIYGLMIMGGQGVAAFAFVIPMAALLTEQEPLDRVIGPDQFRDLGSFLLAFLMIWAYLTLSQLLVIWSGNLPEEIGWYLHRSTGGWRTMGFALIAIHFVVPFFLLLSRKLKRRGRTLALVALLVIFARYVDLFWLVTPAFEHHGVRLHWLDLAALLGVGGLWLWVFLGRLGSRPVVPVGDPSLPEVAA